MLKDHALSVAAATALNPLAVEKQADILWLQFQGLDQAGGYEVYRLGSNMSKSQKKLQAAASQFFVTSPQEPKGDSWLEPKGEAWIEQNRNQKA